jgi:hypothetical protein
VTHRWEASRRPEQTGAGRVDRPHLGSQLARDRYRDMLASAEQHRLARQFRAQATASRPSGRVAQRLRRSLRIAPARRTEIRA